MAPPRSATPPQVLPLPSALIDQIAAGEVVERPSSVVKELVENALDAGARTVAVDLTDGGRGAIVVTDDGHGMGEADLRHAVRRHATSKLRVLSDLDAIGTFGFRGEALSSIASVSRLTLTSRTAGAASGQRLVVHAGEVQSFEAAGCPVGTSVAVQDLFYNTPARRKFLKAAATEQAHVHEALLKTALGRRAGGFTLAAGSRSLLDVPAHAAGHERPALAFGRRQGQLTPFATGGPPLSVSGFLAAPRKSRRDASSVWTFVNGRPVRDRMLQRAAVSGYQARFVDQLGTVLIFVDVAPDAVDVNVHPQKLEVRFRDAREIYEAVARAVAVAAERLGANDDGGARPALPWADAVVRAAAPARPWLLAARERPPAARDAGRPPAPAAHAAAQAAPTLPMPMPLAPAQVPRSAWARLEVLAQAPRGHLCCLGPEQSLTLTPLAGARRRLAEARSERHGRDGGRGWPHARLLLPPAWSVPAAEGPQAEGLLAWLQTDAGRHSGLTLERAGPARLVICAWPSLWPDASPVAAVRAMASLLARVGPTGVTPAAVADAIHEADGWPEQRQVDDLAWGGRLLAALAEAEVAYARPLVQAVEPPRGP